MASQTLSYLLQDTLFPKITSFTIYKSMTQDPKFKIWQIQG